jgi:hypothetical protein
VAFGAVVAAEVVTNRERRKISQIAASTDKTCPLVACDPCAHAKTVGL